MLGPFFSVTCMLLKCWCQTMKCLQAKESSGHSQSNSTQSNSTSTSRGSGGVSGGGASSGSSSSGPNQPVEFNHAISYVNKIKVKMNCFSTFVNSWTPFLMYTCVHHQKFPTSLPSLTYLRVESVSTSSWHLQAIPWDSSQVSEGAASVEGGRWIYCSHSSHWIRSLLTGQ